jgi:glucosylceramidase
VQLPFIKQALEMQPDLKLFASVWSAPKWMKTNNDFHGKSSLKPEHYQVWADYFIKFLDEYAKHDLHYWGLTTQNEPLHGLVFDYGFNCMGWSPEQQRDWIKLHLRPTLTASVYKEIQVIMYDDQRLHLADYADIVRNIFIIIMLHPYKCKCPCNVVLIYSLDLTGSGSGEVY